MIVSGQILPANKLVNVRRRAKRAMGGETIESIVTCPASRHVMMMADAVAAKRKYHMLAEEPEHCAGSIYSVLESLWKARAEIKRLRAESGGGVAVRLHRAHWWCGACNWHGQREDSINANKAGKLCCPQCGNTDVREKGSPLFKAA